MIFTSSLSLAQSQSGAKVTPVNDIGEGAYLKPVTIPNAATKIVTLTFLKANSMVQVQVWKNAAPVDQIARAAAKQVLAQLP